VAEKTEVVFGVATDGARVFLTFDGSDVIGVLADGKPLAPLRSEGRPRGIAVNGSRLEWVNAEARGGDPAGIYGAALDGTGRARIAANVTPPCRAFDRAPTNTLFVAREGARVLSVTDGAAVDSWPGGEGNVEFLAVAPLSNAVVWSTSKGVVRAALAPRPSAVTTISDRPAKGLAFREPWVYVTAADGGLVRMRLDGSETRVLWKPKAPPQNLGDLEVTPDGTTAMWASDRSVLAYRLTP